MTGLVPELDGYAYDDKPAGDAGVAGNKYGPSKDDKSERKSAATVLVELALERHTIGMSTDGEPFAVSKAQPHLVRQLRGGKASLRAELARLYRQATGKVAPQQALADALLALEGEAGDTDPQPLALRVADHHGDRYLDLGDATGRAIRITAAGWEVVDNPPVLFRRTVLTAPLPEPKRGATLDDLWKLLNVAEVDRPLIAAYLVSVLHLNLPHPVLALFGEQGTGKTSAAKVIVGLLDPSPVPVRKPPRDADSWVTAAAGSWVVGLDNLSVVSEWLSDTLCRAVTGEGDVKRQLYTDGGLVVFAFRRCILLTGIDLGALKGDLADRLLVADLAVIDGSRRLEETALWRRWEQVHPYLLGALLDLAAGVESVLPSVRLDSKPRMADFARILAAVDAVLGTAGLSRYADRADSLAVDSLSGDPFVIALSETVPIEGFRGAAAELLELVTPIDDKRLPKGWPTSPRAVTTLLKKQAPVMRRAGWKITDTPASGHDKTVRWELHRPKTKVGNDTRDPRNTRTDGPFAGVAGNAGNEYGQSKGDGDLLDRFDRCPVHRIPVVFGTCPKCDRERPQAADERACSVCSLPLDPAATVGGFTTHPACERAA
jgi:hypothetical protein